MVSAAMKTRTHTQTHATTRQHAVVAGLRLHTWQEQDQTEEPQPRVSDGDTVGP